MKKSTLRFLSSFLAVLMIVSILPVSAVANEGTGYSGPDDPAYLSTLTSGDTPGSDPTGPSAMSPADEEPSDDDGPGGPGSESADKEHARWDGSKTKVKTDDPGRLVIKFGKDNQYTLRSQHKVFPKDAVIYARDWDEEEETRYRNELSELKKTENRYLGESFRDDHNYVYSFSTLVEFTLTCEDWKGLRLDDLKARDFALYLTTEDGELGAAESILNYDDGAPALFFSTNLLADLLLTEPNAEEKERRQKEAAQEAAAAAAEQAEQNGDEVDDGHIWGDWTVTAEATCTEDGSRERTCSDCGKTETEVISAEHVWGDWTETTEVTCTENGTRERACTRCDETETEVIPAAGHTWDTDDEEAAADCTVCGEHRDENRTYGIELDGDFWRQAGDEDAVEYNEYWDALFGGVVYTENWADDLLTIAVSQIGYTASTENYLENEAGETRPYTRYGDWYGFPYSDWCAMFVSFCLNYARIPAEAMPRECGCTRWIDDLTEHEMFTAAADYVPRPGDLIFFDYIDPVQDGLSDHVGIVWIVNEQEGSVTTIEGALNNSVDQRMYALDDAVILGYGILPENQELLDQAALAAAMPAQSFEETVDDVTVTVVAEIGAFPADTRMEITIVDDEEILNAAAEAVLNESPVEDSDGGEAADADADVDEAPVVDDGSVSGTGEEDSGSPAESGAEKKVSQIRAVDITFYDVDGNEIEPAIPVRVTMKSTRIKTGRNADVVHIDNEGGAAKVENADKQADAVSFDAGGFSVFVMVETESISAIYLTADGSTYEVTVTYDESAGIPENAQLLVSEITEEDADYASYVEQTAAVINTEADRLCYVKLLDISIVDENGDKVVPDALVDVKVRLLDKRVADEEAALSTTIVHFAEDAEKDSAEAEILDNVIKESTVSFQTESFSVYAIVEAPGLNDIPPAGWTEIKSAAELRQYGSSGIYIRHVNGYYFTDVQYDIDANRTGVRKTAQSSGDPSTSGAALYYFENVQGTTNQFIVSTGEGEDKKYLQGGYSTNSLRFTPDENAASIFRIVDHPNQEVANSFVVEYIADHGASDKCVNMHRGLNGQGFAIYKLYETSTSEADPNARIQLLYNAPPAEDPYHLDGQRYGLVRYDADYNTNPKAKGLAMMATLSNNGSLVAQAVDGKMEYLDFFDDYFLAPGSEITMWGFEYVDTAACNNYRIWAMVGGAKKYLGYGNGAISGGNYKLAFYDEPTDETLLTVNGGSGDKAGMIQLRFTNCPQTRYLYNNITNANTPAGYFCGRNATDVNTWFYLATPTDLSDGAFDPYTATKISVSDPSLSAPYTEAHPNPKVIVYTRIWDEEISRYKFFAIDKDGNLIRCYDGGGEIFWYDIEPENLMWEFTEYLGSDGKPSWYYELQSWYYKSIEETNQYIAPQITGGQILSSSKIGVNMSGRHYGDYFSKIIAWDDPQYAYAGLLANLETNTLEAAPMSLSNDWYFAIVNESGPEEKLTTADTIDHTAYGISMRMFDYNEGEHSSANSWQSTVMGGYQQGGQNPVLNLVTRNLADNGYPTATQGGKHSLQELFPAAPTAGVQKAQTVNHLFIQQTYAESGYFEFDSTQNYAFLDEESGNFIVFDQLGTFESNNSAPSVTIQHGQFDPYNQIGKQNEAGEWVPLYGHTKLYPNYNTEVTNKYDIHGNLLSPMNPRYDETLYKNGTRDTMDFHFGMEVNATFMQSPDGKDDWGHDIIFEFSGDDDFWLYVDGVLVLDIGGTHYASDGWVNFATGKIYNQGLGNTTLRTVFRKAYLEKNPGASEADINNYLNEIFDGEVFKNYTSHEMKALYMERGANASNLHMRFNLAPVKAGAVELEKHIAGTDKQSYASVKFPYQIFWRYPGETDWRQVTVAEQGSTVLHAVKVFYKNSGEPVDCAAKYPSEDNNLYQDVFFLLPEQHALIEFPAIQLAPGGDAGDAESIEYYIQECHINKTIYNLVEANEIRLTDDTNYESVAPDGDPRYDYRTAVSTIQQRKMVSYVNHVNPDALRSLTITKNLHGKEGPLQSTDPNAAGYDPSPFRFRIYLGEELEPYSIDTYYVKNPAGEYCYRINGEWVSTGKSNFSDLTDDELDAVSFVTGPAGTASNIQAGYSVEIRNLLPETVFKVEERPNDVPIGYDLGYYPSNVDPYSGKDPYTPGDIVDYERGFDGNNATYALLQTGVYNKGEIRDGDDARLKVHNRKGWGLSIQKTWSDSEFMDSHDDIYFAVYLRSGTSEPYTYTLMDGSVRSMSTSESSLVYFLDELVEEYPFSEGEGDNRIPNYVLFEVQLTGNPYKTEDGSIVGYESITRIGEGMYMNAGGVQIGQSHAMYRYRANYGNASWNSTGNGVSYSVANIRPGVKIIKRDWDDNALLDAEFTLKQGDEYYGSESYVSGDYGVVVMAYFGTDLPYTLAELSAPSGYVRLPESVNIQVGSTTNLVTVESTIDPSNISIVYMDSDPAPTEEQLKAADVIVERTPTDNVQIATIIVRDRKAGLELLKLSSLGDTPLPGVHFQLYRKLANGNWQSMPAYTNLVTDENGKLPTSAFAGLNNNNRTYKLVEKEPYPENHKPLGFDIIFTLSPDGTVTLDAPVAPDPGSDQVQLIAPEEDSESRIYTLQVTNEINGYPIRFKKISAGDQEPLPDAEFTTAMTGEEITLTSGEDGILSYTDGEGTVVNLFTLAISDDPYHLTETVVPDGYIKLPGDVTVTLSSDPAAPVTAGRADDPTVEYTVEGPDDAGVYTVIITNDVGTVLPSTGGKGTLAFTLGGAMLTAGAAVMLGTNFRSRKGRRREQE